MGLFRRAPKPEPTTTGKITPYDVAMFALEAVRTLAPDVQVEREGLALRIHRGGRVLVWNLQDVARLAPDDPAWRDGVRKMALKVLEARQPAPGPTLGMDVRLRPSARVPAELRTGEYGAECVIGDVWALYGDSRGERFAVGKWADLPPREHVRAMSAMMTLGRDFKPRDIMSPVDEGLPLYTNAKFHPHAAVALLMPVEWWKMIMGAFDPAPSALVVAVPAPSRIFVALDDDPALVAAMHQLSDAALELEEEVLSTDLFRFDGTAWSVIAAPQSS
jgi:hypothetical protein